MDSRLEAAWYGIKELLQADANMKNAVTDSLIGLANTALYTNPTLWPVKAHFGTIPYWDWSRDLWTEESGEPGSWRDTHGWSKFSSGISMDAALAAASMGGTAAGSTRVTSLPGKFRDWGKGKIVEATKNVRNWWRGAPNLHADTTVLGHYPSYTQLAAKSQQLGRQ